MNDISEIKRIGMLSKGKKQLLRHLNGENLTIRQMVFAKCYDCMGYFADGRQDCQLFDCPLYPLQPYGSKPKPKKVGGRGPNKGTFGLKR